MISLSKLGPPLKQAQLCSGTLPDPHTVKRTMLLKPAVPRLHAHARHRERRSRANCTTSSGDSDDDGGNGDDGASRPRRYSEGEASI
jgi:hypothetical protein